MSPYRTPANPPIEPSPPDVPQGDREDRIVHLAIGVIGGIGCAAGGWERDFHAAFAVALILLIVGIGGALRGFR